MEGSEAVAPKAVIGDGEVPEEDIPVLLPEGELIDRETCVHANVDIYYEHDNDSEDVTEAQTHKLGSTLMLTTLPLPETAESTAAWKSSLNAVATVTDGVVNPVKEGTATITATLTRGGILKFASAKFTVVDLYKPRSFVLKETGTQRSK